MRGSLNKHRCNSPFNPQECQTQDFNEPKTNKQLEGISHHPTRHFLRDTKLLKTSFVLLSIHIASHPSCICSTSLQRKLGLKEHLLSFPPNTLQTSLKPPKVQAWEQPQCSLVWWQGSSNPLGNLFPLGKPRRTFSSTHKVVQSRNLPGLLLRSSNLQPFPLSLHTLLKDSLHFLLQQSSTPSSKATRHLSPNLIQEENPLPLSTIFPITLLFTNSNQISKVFDSTPNQHFPPKVTEPAFSSIAQMQQSCSISPILKKNNKNTNN